MRRRRFAFWVVLLLASIPCSAVEFGDRIRDVLEAAPEVELLSIFPRRAAQGVEDFHGWRVLGRTRVKGEDARRLISAFRQSLREDGGMSPACFNPRHAIRATESVFDGALKGAGIPLARDL